MTRTGPIIGLFVQVVLLATLAATVGLDIVGWLTGVTYGFITCAALMHGLSRLGDRAFGPADWVTLIRAMLVGCVSALIAASFHGNAPVEVLVGIAAVALVLDSLDGLVARRTGTASRLGARFDMEVDAFFILVLSVYVARSIGAWVFAIGAMRYAFLVASWALHWLRRPPPPRYWRKVVAATQGVMLVVATADIVPAAMMVALLATALALLVESFGRDVVWLYRHRVVEPALLSLGP